MSNIENKLAFILFFKGINHFFFIYMIILINSSLKKKFYFKYNDINNGYLEEVLNLLLKIYLIMKLHLWLFINKFNL